MKTIKKKDIRTQFENALNQIILDLELSPNKKLKSLLKQASKKLGKQVKEEIKKQKLANVKAEKKLQKALKQNGEKKKVTVRKRVAVN